MPEKNNLTPSYEQKNFQDKIDTRKDTLLVSPEGQDESLKIHQDILVWAKKNKTNEKWQKQLNPKRKYWLQVVKGEMDLASIALSTGDGLAIAEEEHLMLNSKDESEILFFDMK